MGSMAAMIAFVTLPPIGIAEKLPKAKANGPGPAFPAKKNGRGKSRPFFWSSECHYGFVQATR
jgi:hypothetical protein